MAKKILMVDDEADVLKVFGKIIRSWGYEVIAAASGKEAVEIAKNQNVDIVILDYLMPGMDGITTLKEMRKINKEIPAIMFSACSDAEIIKSTEKFGIILIPKLSRYQDTQATLKVIIQTICEKLDNQNFK
jgi:CheY-like chemotaxis protein